MHLFYIHCMNNLQLIKVHTYIYRDCTEDISARAFKAVHQTDNFFLSFLT